MDLTSTRVKAVGFFGGLLLLLAFGYWKLAPSGDDPLNDIVADLQKRSIPAAARVLKKSEPERDRFAARAVWEIELNQDWNDYSRDIVKRFHDFKIQDSGDGKIVMSKQLPGDTLSLTIEKIADNPLKVRISFRGYPS